MNGTLSFAGSKKNPSLSLMGIRALEEHVDSETVLYILRALYRLVLASMRRQENQTQLQKRIRCFEEECHLPGFLSSMSMSQFLLELEDAQYYYPILEREVDFDAFH